MKNNILNLHVMLVSGIKINWQDKNEILTMYNHVMLVIGDIHDI